MKYSKYFKGVLHNDGLPQLNAKQWARMMNIAALEYGITRLERIYNNSNAEFQQLLLDNMHLLCDKD